MAKLDLSSLPQQERGPSRLTWILVVIAVLGPLSLLEKTGYMETLEAAERYTSLILGFGADHPIDTAGLRAAAATADDAELSAALHRVDAELMRWTSDLGALYERASSMAVVSTLQSDATISMTYDRPAGAGKRPLKRQFHPQRDASILLYLLLSVAVFLVPSPPLAALVLVMNVLNLLICFWIKGMSDALRISAQQLDDVTEALVLVPMRGPELAAAQSLLLAKVAALSAAWQGAELGMNVALPGLGALAVNIYVMASVAAGTMLRCVMGLASVAGPLRSSLPHAIALLSIFVARMQLGSGRSKTRRQ